MPMIELLNMLYELRLDVEKQKGTHYDHMRSLDKMIQIVKPYADQENNNEKHSEELFNETDIWIVNWTAWNGNDICFHCFSFCDNLTELREVHS